MFGYSPSFSSENYVIYDFYDVENPTEKRKSFSSFQGDRCVNVVIYGSAIVNGYIDKILSQVSSDNIAVLGFSSIYAPHTLRKYGVNLIGISKFLDGKKGMRVVCEGGRSELSALIKNTLKRFELNHRNIIIAFVVLLQLALRFSLGNSTLQSLPKNDASLLLIPSFNFK